MSDSSESENDTGIERLKGDSNFYVWKAFVKNKLVSYNYWNITSGATPRPDFHESEPSATTMEAQMVWEIWSANAICYICNLLSPEINHSFSLYETAPAMWKALMARFHRHEPHDLLKSFNAICALEYSDDSTDSFGDYLWSFEEHWDDLRYRCDDADPPVAGTGNSLESSLKVLANSDQSKKEFLIASLPESMFPFLCNLQVKYGNEMGYIDLYTALVRYHALVEHRKVQIALEEAQSVDCTWCRSRGFECEGHEWKECTLLRQFKRRNR